MLTCSSYGNEIRWSEGERLHHLFEARCDAFDATGDSDHLAVIADDGVLTFRELDNRANQLARFLISSGLGAGDRIGLLLDKGAQTYIALLAVLKINAAYVPLDCGFPNERIEFILGDAMVKAALTLSRFAPKFADIEINTIFIDEMRPDIEACAEDRLSESETGPVEDQLAYLIYTSGTTGKPKGVIIEHASICNFVRVAAETYGIRSHDRVYQGMTIAFDFSVEELWVPLLAGATLVPAKAGASLVGDDLADFLEEHRISVMCCVPTLLATIERNLPDMRILLVSGEACPHGLVSRWHRPGRTILNAYGPTEATVTATLTELYPEKPVTIGGPLPTYTIVVLDEFEPRELADGETGEIAIAGIGLATGYLNREELTAEKFIPDFLDIPNNPSGRIYRTGDLGRINEVSEVEFLGRIDTQVKLRGYRIELTEIESVLLEFPQIAQAVVDVWQSEPDTKELVAYYTLNQGYDELPYAETAQLLRDRLPPYMVPAYMEQLPVIPMTVNNKADRKKLPPPTGSRFTVISSNYIAPTNKMEAILAEELCNVLGIERASIDDHFFQDLGAHSLLMAKFGNGLRKRLAHADISMRDIYLNPTIRKLAATVQDSATQVEVEYDATPPATHIPSNRQYYGCGALQLIFYVGYGVFFVYGLFGIWILLTGFHWTYAAVDDTTELYVRIVLFLLGSYVGLSIIPIALKWLLIGRWKEETIPIWSLCYFRFWLVKMLVNSAPMAMFPGGPVYNVYLRLLGAKIGRDVVLGSSAPVCTDLFSVGDNTIIRDKSLMPGYKAESNYIHIGSIHIGKRAFVGSGSVLDINTEMEDDTQLGHSSCLQNGQQVPEGKHYHGTPAEETQVDYCTVEARTCSTLRRWLYSILLATPVFAFAFPLTIMALYWAFPYALAYTRAAELDYSAPISVLMVLGPDIFFVTLSLFLTVFVFGLLSIAVVPRLLNLFLREGKSYVLFGFHYYIQSLVSAASNSAPFNLLFGDSSYIVYYLKWIGYKLNRVQQTGANFGLDQVHDNPFLCDIGSGTMVSDGLAMVNSEMSNTSFRLSRVKIGELNYLGNNILYPAGGRTGANVLLGTKVMIPIDGPLRENVGLLGSPSFEIPRMVERDKEISRASDIKLKRKMLANKGNYNLATMLMFLTRNFFLFYIIMLFGYMAILYYQTYGISSIFTYCGFISLFALLFYILVERASLNFGSLQAKEVSLYDPYFLFHERHWKFCGHPLTRLFAGTPFRNVISRMLGVKIGKKVFDDGANLYDKTLLEIGDYANLNFASVVQGHSLEEGVFKSDHVKIGKSCTLECGAFVHYGVTIGDSAILGPNAFLMKGETIDPGAVWQGNPARAVMRAQFVTEPAIVAQSGAEIAA